MHVDGACAQVELVGASRRFVAAGRRPGVRAPVSSRSVRSTRWFGARLARRGRERQRARRASASAPRRAGARRRAARRPPCAESASAAAAAARAPPRGERCLGLAGIARTPRGRGYAPRASQCVVTSAQISPRTGARRRRARAPRRRVPHGPASPAGRGSGPGLELVPVQRVLLCPRGTVERDRRQCGRLRAVAGAPARARASTARSASAPQSEREQRRPVQGDRRARSCGALSAHDPPRRLGIAPQQRELGARDVRRSPCRSGRRCAVTARRLRARARERRLELPLARTRASRGRRRALSGWCMSVW